MDIIEKFFFFGITEAWIFNSADLADEFQKASDSTKITLRKKNFKLEHDRLTEGQDDLTST